MVLHVPPSRVPLAGPSAHWTLAVAGIVAVAIVVVAVLSRTAWSQSAGTVSPPPVAAVPGSATPTPAGSRAARPSPTSWCTPREVIQLEEPIVRQPRPLKATGFEAMSPWTGSEDFLVADRLSGFWALGSGRLTRLDSEGRITGSWTFADDELFDAWGIVAARSGGVWLFGGSAVAWFDGAGFRNVIDVPAGGSGVRVVDVAEAPDTSVWVVTTRSIPATLASDVLRWDGASWTPICGRPTRAEISHIAIDPAGRVWVAPTDSPWDVVSFDGRIWSTWPTNADFDRSMIWSSAQGSDLVAGDDGAVWLAFGGVGRFAGSRWSGMQPEGVDLSGTVSLAAAPDGGVWAATGSTVLPADSYTSHPGIGIVRFDGRTWTTYGDADGLPAPDPSTASTITAVAASQDGVVAATRDGFYRLTGDRWVRTVPRPALGASPWPSAILAVSADEAWVSDWDGRVWNIRADGWTELEIAAWEPHTLFLYDLARAPDGALAVATDRGAAVLRDGLWSVLGEGETHDVTFAGDGALWIGERKQGSEGTFVTSFRFDGHAWVGTVLPPLTTPGRPMLVVDRDGMPWVGSGGYLGSLDRFDGRHWVDESPFASSDPINVAGLAVGPAGDLWLAFFVLTTGGTGWGWGIGRYDGTTWSILDPVAGPIGSGLFGPGAVAAAPDGSLWLTTQRGVARFDGQRWSSPFGSHLFTGLSFAPDGTLWAVGPSGGAMRLPAAD